MNYPHVERDFSEALSELTQVFGDRFMTSESVCRHYTRDESFHVSRPPHGVIQPQTREEVQEIVRLCARHRMPVVPRGAGTSLEGNCLAVNGGVCIDTARMNRIVAVNHEDFDVVVQPGVTRRQLNRHLKDTGLFFPIDPGADATLGGMASTRASGTNAVRYGSMRENVVNLEVVLADGSLIRTARRACKSAAGYDLTRLMVGSEGTLGVITELTIRLYPVPESIMSASCAFATVEGAVDTVIAMIQYGIPVARVELLDEQTMSALNSYSKTDFAVAPTLFFEFHGSEQTVREQVETTGEIADQNGGRDFVWARTTEERNRMWRARHDVAYSSRLLHPRGQIWSTDVCVPISRLADCINETRRDVDETGILAPMVGHVGDGNFHLLLLVDHDDPEEVARAEALHGRMVRRALAMDGTCTGEHGIGYGKCDFLKIEHGAAVEPMKLVKQALDPDNILNPGKIFEWQDALR